MNKGKSGLFSMICLLIFGFAGVLQLTAVADKKPEPAKLNFVEGVLLDTQYGPSTSGQGREDLVELRLHFAGPDGDKYYFLTKSAQRLFIFKPGKPNTVRYFNSGKIDSVN